MIGIFVRYVREEFARRFVTIVLLFSTGTERLMWRHHTVNRDAAPANYHTSIGTFS